MKKRGIQLRRPKIIRRRQHQISSQHISENALKVMQQLQKSGYSAYLVGGSVRDLLIDLEPKDFDVATDASPEQIRKLFNRSRIIGRRFRLVHVYFRNEIIEVSTFRANSDGINKPSELTMPVLTDAAVMLAADNTYGTIEEDAWRRDFTINALYYNYADNTVIDYTDGMRDLKRRYICMIGEPVQRFHEDPVRLLRAIRFAAKLDFKIDLAIEECLSEFAHLLYHVPAARILDELMKLFFTGHASATYRLLNEYGYFAVLFPQTAAAIQMPVSLNYSQFFDSALQATDYRFSEHMSLNPGFLFSVFLWPALQAQLNKSVEANAIELAPQHFRKVVPQLLADQNQIFLLSRRMRKMIRSIWLLQYYLIHPKRHRVYRILMHRYFRAAIDFLQLRVAAGEPFGELAEFWQQLRTSDPATCRKIIAELSE